MKLTKVEDPELGIDIWNLGLIYNLEIIEDKIKVKMTFTTPLCPFGPELVEQVESALSEVGFKPEVDVTFEPPWEPSEDVKIILGIA